MFDKKILAVSGGIDSMVMLDIFSHDSQVIVAHFHHGTRKSADADAAFVASVAQKKHLPFVSAKEILGPNVSENLARQKRYEFLHAVADRYHGQIYTAHHGNDLIESIAINILRGTGWRGLAVLDSYNTIRPFIRPQFLPSHLKANLSKDTVIDRSWICRYAAQHNLSFRSDPSNYENLYLRNRLRPLLAQLPSDKKRQLYHLYYSQIKLKTTFADLVRTMFPDNFYSREFFSALEPHLACELLTQIVKEHHLNLTRPQAKNLLHAVLTYQSGTLFNLPKNTFIRLHQNHFSFC